MFVVTQKAMETMANKDKDEEIRKLKAELVDQKLRYSKLYCSKVCTLQGRTACKAIDCAHRKRIEGEL